MKKGVLLILVSIILAFSVGVSFAGNVDKGMKLFNDPSLGTNGKSCSTCHPKGTGIDGRKTTFTIMGKEQKSLEEAVNFCIGMALEGKPLDNDSEQMKDLVSYLKTLKGKKVIKGC